MLSIGDLARATGCSVSTIRYYEEIRLIGPAPRGAGRQRFFERQMVETLRFIRRCRDFDFPIEDIRNLAPPSQMSDDPCAPARAIAEKHLRRLDQQMRELRALRIALSGMVEACRSECPDGDIGDCCLMSELRANTAPYAPQS